MTNMIGMYAMHNDAFDYNLLSVFDAMLRERSVTRAAEQLGLTQSAMSHASTGCATTSTIRSSSRPAKAWRRPPRPRPWPAPSSK